MRGVKAGIAIEFLIVLVLGWIPLLEHLIAGFVAGAITGRGPVKGGIAGFIAGIAGVVIVALILVGISSLFGAIGMTVGGTGGIAAIILSIGGFDNGGRWRHRGNYLKLISRFFDDSHSRTRRRF